MEGVAAPVFDGGGKQIEVTGFPALNVEKHRAALKMVLNVLQGGIAHDFKQRVTGRDPFQRGIALEQLLIEANAAVFAPQAAKSRFQGIAALDEQPGHLAHPVNMTVRRRGLGPNPHHRAGLHEELFDGFRDQAAFAGFHRAAHNRREVQFLLGEALKADSVMARNRLGSTSWTMRSLTALSLVRRAYKSRNSFSRRLAGNTSPTTSNT